MIFRPIKFQVLYRIADGWRLEEVAELLFTPGYGLSSVKTITEVELPVDPINVSVIQFTGQFDKEGVEIYHAALLSDAVGTIWEVVAYSGGFHLQAGERTAELDDAMCMTLKVVGNALADGKLIMPEDPEEVLKASAARRILPPLVTLKPKSK